MDMINPFSIKKNIPLLKRFSSTRETTQLDLKQTGWIVYSAHLSQHHFQDIDFFIGEQSIILATWKVGHYDVAAIAGEMTPEHKTILDALELDYAEVKDIPDLSKPGIILFDMDSTAIEIECIDEIAKLAGVGKQVSEVTERAMQGELDFKESLIQRVGTLAGADEAILAKVKSELPFMPEVRELVATMHKYGWKPAIASGGFTYFSDYLKDELSLVHAQSNQLEIVDGKLTGKVLGDIVSAETKAEILVELADKYDIEISNTVAVGDGANDLVMMEAAGLGIAYHAKPKVQQKAQTAVRHADLGGVACILSVSLLLNKKLSW
ncbi:phosphoserine phosphatase [Aliivibrio sp. S4TY2]|uniref:phosphoserine phosphatase n=1 Tax=unclassified Aliivibrio TaxID=2645654 RepID=UPI0023790A03|nr:MULTISPECIES: phosphoserine phosphatase [unclassified Aliivibrio]MDD9157237.1 phosphoserine phosphatase [Aliivibrio sp. S4TY2]MDD9161119.1 phosphoserine phosphatase [Aliivibrio sp. S4TY1]MDD9165149.1 phosphoserine phosphatase [Aliivibrio sp. S4MY2]MDD9169147.1 phosphoserine phosphatase [Aliivibrio sp. S4MY4]MDD9186030.1 phosphoserine phosphatase [Aliivibrio sp. S4MY3]